MPVTLASIQAKEDAARHQAQVVARNWQAWRSELAQVVNLLLDRQDTNVQLVSTDLTASATWDRGKPLISVGEDFFAEIVSHGASSYPLFKGVIYHELSHFMWTPGSTQAYKLDLEQYLKGIGPEGQQQVFQYTYNAMEDNRIELLTAKKWRPMPKFFAMVNLTLVHEHLTQNPDYPSPLDWLLYTHRVGIPDSVKQAARESWDDRFGGRSDDAMVILNKFMASDMSTSAGQHTAAQLVIDLYELMIEEAEKAGDPPPELGRDSSQGDNGETPSSSGPQMPGGEGAPQLSESDAEAAGSPPPSAPPGGPENGNEPGESEGDGGGGSGAGGDQLKEDIENALSEIEQDTIIKEDARRTSESIKSRMGKQADLSETTNQAAHLPYPITPEMHANQRTVSRLFRKLRHDIEDEWQQDMLGKLDGLRYTTRKLRPGNFDFFRHFEQGGEKAGSTHIVIAIDRSGSMSGRPIAEVSQAAWVIQKAAAEIDAKVEIILYDTDVVVGVKPPKGMYSHYSARGGTLGAPPALKAFEALAPSPARNRFYIALSDGEWYDQGTATDAIRQLNSIGVTTCLLDIGSKGRSSYSTAVHANVRTPAEIVPFAQRFITQSLMAAKKGR